MTDEDFKEFSETLAGLAACYPNAKPLEAAQVKAYFRLLRDFDLTAVQAAIDSAPSRHPSFFPAAGELLQSLEGRVEDQANQAWTLLLEASDDGGYSSLRLFDKLQAGAMVATFGSWLEFCQAVRDCSAEMLAHYSKNFRSHYATLRRSPREVSLYHIGQTEASLRSNGKAWAATRPQFFGRVLLVGKQRVIGVEVPFETASGQIGESVRAILLGGDAAAIGQLAESQRQSDQRAVALALAGIEAAPQLTEGGEPDVEEVQRIIQNAARRLSLVPVAQAA